MSDEERDRFVAALEVLEADLRRLLSRLEETMEPIS